MRTEPSKLAQLVISYYEKFGRHVPERALRTLNAGDLVPMLQHSLATGVPLPESGWNSDPPLGFSPRGCCIVVEISEGATPTKLPSGEWLH